VKKNSFKMVMFLLSHNADTDQFDYFHRTPLYFACLQQNIKIIKVTFLETNNLLKLLLVNFSSPWSDAHINYDMVCINRPRCLALLKISRQLQIIMLLTPLHKQAEQWRTGTIYYLNLKDERV